jgi:hypothetical protein
MIVNVPFALGRVCSRSVTKRSMSTALGTSDDPRRTGEEGRQMVTETDDLPIRLQLTLGPARNASNGGARE